MEDVVPEDERGRVTGQELLTEEEGLRQSLGTLLDDVGEAHPELRPVPEEPDERRLVLGGRDDEDVAKPGVHERGDRVVHHRLVVHRQQLLADPTCDRPQPRPGSPRKHDALHGEILTCAGRPLSPTVGFRETSRPRAVPPRPEQGDIVKILVTGAAGFIGSNYVREQLADAYPETAGAEVTVLDN